MTCLRHVSKNINAFNDHANIPKKYVKHKSKEVKNISKLALLYIILKKKFNKDNLYRNYLLLIHNLNKYNISWIGKTKSKSYLN